MNYKCALITGASAGIGAAVAETLAERGVHLVLLARRQDRLEKLRTHLIEKYGVQVEAAAVDMRSVSEIQSFTQNPSPLLRQVDVLINNAGLAKGTDKIADADPADWDAMWDTNVKGLLYITRQLLPQMLKGGAGHVINLGSVAGRWVYPGGAVYCATKFAVRALSEGLRMDLLGTGVRVTNIEPGMVETEFSQVRFNDAVKAKAVYQGMQPLLACDIAETIVWCLERPMHVNVQEIVLFPTDQAAIQLVHRQNNSSSQK